MKFRTITLKFSQPLTEDQEGILRANLDAIRDDATRKLDVALNEIEHGWAFKGVRAIPMNALAVTALQAAMMGLRINIAKFIVVEKVAPDLFVFKYARDELALVKLKQHRWLSPIRETLVIDGLKRFVFPDMKIDGNTVEITRGDSLPEDEKANKGL